MKNNNGASIRKLSNRSLRNNRMRNTFAILAIILTSILFTATFSLTSGIMQVTQENIMREIGGKFHAGLKKATTEQYEKVIADPLVKRSSYNIFIGLADNIIKRQAELRYTPEESTLEDMFITLEEGRMPQAENEIIVDTFTLDELMLPYALGEKIPIKFTFMGEPIEDEFIVCGYYQGDHIAHASELFFSENYWLKLKGSLTDEDFVNWSMEHPEDSNVGLRAVNFFFDNASQIEEKVRTVIQNAGYEPGTEIAYGVNWAYFNNRLESVDPFTIILLCTAIMVIIITGYLIIYNIFQISVISDIKFYGLLKTIGTTKKQLHKLIRRQAIILSLIGIPIGLLLGYGIGKLTLPFSLGLSAYKDMDISLHFNPWIFIFSAAFSALTVFLSSNRPGKIAGNVSPIEAIKYTETKQMGKKAIQKKKKSNHYSALSMAFSSLGRSKRTTVTVITAISFSIILLAIVMTFAASFQIDEFMEQRIVGDFLLGNNNYTSEGNGADLSIDPGFLALADSQEGILNREKMMFRNYCYLQVDEKALAQLQKLKEEGKLREDMHSIDHLEGILNEEKPINGYFYGYSENLLSNLNVLEGELDIDKFLTGDYIILTQILGAEHLPAQEHIYHPGDTVTIDMVTEDSIAHEILDEAGQTFDIWYENLESREYEVMAIVDIPQSMNLHRYTANGCDAILPVSELDENSLWTKCFAVSYEIDEASLPAFETAIKEYCESNINMGYISKSLLKAEFDDMISIVSTIGITLAMIIAFIGILNFVNAMTTEIIARKQEFAMLQSIGMTNAQLKQTLIYEGISYIAISGIISLILGSLLSWAFLNAVNHMILFFEYQFQIMPFVIMLPLLIAVAIITPLFAYRNINRKSIVERLRDNE